MDADFLAIYRIDLRDPDLDLSAEVFFARAFRLFAYRGSMREEARIEHENNEPRPVTAVPSPGPQRQADSGEKWVSPDEMKTLFPDLCAF